MSHSVLSPSIAMEMSERDVCSGVLRHGLFLGAQPVINLTFRPDNMILRCFRAVLPDAYYQQF